jgi:hypothetical protein
VTSVSEQIIKKYCGSVEERVAACRDKKVAQYLKQSIFNEIKQQCKSGPVLDFVKKYIENLIQERFRTNKS